MKILAFGASSSKNSINKKLATYASQLVQGADVEIIDLNDYEMPLFSVDKEVEIGKPEAVDRFLSKIKWADALIISFAEHNGANTAAYKNIFDWCSRTAKKVYENKKVILLSTSPGPGGAKSSLSMAVTSMPFFGATVLASLSIPSFNQNFDVVNFKLTHEGLDQELLKCLRYLEKSPN